MNTLKASGSGMKREGSGVWTQSPATSRQCELHGARVAAPWWAASSLSPSSVARGWPVGRPGCNPQANGTVQCGAYERNMCWQNASCGSKSHEHHANWSGAIGPFCKATEAASDKAAARPARTLPRLGLCCAHS